MARLVPAATQLLLQLSQDERKYKVSQGEPDGLGRIRSLTFDAHTSRWLAPILDAISDPRIKTINTNGRGRATVTFVSDYRADFRSHFPIDEVDAILNDDA
jgi:hypothetical protein